MSEEFLKRIEEFAKMAEEIAGDAPSEEELGDNYEWIEFFEEVANVVNAYANLPKKEGN